MCLDTFHVISWATTALDEARRTEWNRLRQTGAAKAAREFKGLRFLLRRNWENLTGAQCGVIRGLATANSRTFRGWQLTRSYETSSPSHCSKPDPQAFITMIRLDRAGLAPDLPWNQAT